MPFLTLLVIASGLRAAPPTQADVFKSIQDHVGGNRDVDMSKFLPFALAGAGAAILAVLFGQRRQRRQRRAVPQGLNHHGKLLKEVVKSVQLRPSELRQLKLLAEDAPPDDGPLVSPLTLMLCPTVMAKSINLRKERDGRVKVDRKALAQLARKAGVTQEMLDAGR